MEIEHETVDYLVSLLMALSVEDPVLEVGEVTRQDLLTQILPTLADVITTQDAQVLNSVKNNINTYAH